MEFSGVKVEVHGAEGFLQDNWQQCLAESRASMQFEQGFFKAQ